MTKGVLLRIFMLEGQRHRGELLYDWLLRHAREMGITGGAAFREIAGHGRHVLIPPVTYLSEKKSGGGSLP